MKNLQSIISAIIMVMFLSVLTSCDTVSPTNSGIDPFTNSGNERNMLVVISDMHLGADLSYAECKDNLGALEKLLEQIRVAPNVKELVIAGDLLDEWFVPATTDTYEGTDQSNFVQRIAETNKGVFDALNQIIQAQEILVTYLPGNHDLTITAEDVELVLPGINQARDVSGLGTYSPAYLPELVIEHCHRYCFFCSPDPISNQDVAPGTILPPGYFFTRIAALHVKQNCHTAGDTIPVVTPNTSGIESQNLLFGYWENWKRTLLELPIENMFDENIIVTNVDGFTGTYSVNDILPYQTTVGGFIDVDLFNGIQDTWVERQIHNMVADTIPVAQAIANVFETSHLDDQAKVQYFMNPNSNKRIVVFGHTHIAKIITSENYNGQKSIYANSGTWIDHQLGAATATFVVITPQNDDASSQTYVKLYNFENEIVTKMAEDSLRI